MNGLQFLARSLLKWARTLQKRHVTLIKSNIEWNPRKSFISKIATQLIYQLGPLETVEKTSEKSWSGLTKSKSLLERLLSSNNFCYLFIEHGWAEMISTYLMSKVHCQNCSTKQTDAETASNALMKWSIDRTIAHFSYGQGVVVFSELKTGKEPMNKRSTLTAETRMAWFTSDKQ